MKQVTLITAAMLAVLVLVVRGGNKKVDVSRFTTHPVREKLSRLQGEGRDKFSGSQGSNRGELSELRRPMADRRFLPRLQNRDGRVVPGFHCAICHQLPRAGKVIRGGMSRTVFRKPTAFSKWVIIFAGLGLALLVPGFVGGEGVHGLLRMSRRHVDHGRDPRRGCRCLGGKGAGRRVEHGR